MAFLITHRRPFCFAFPSRQDTYESNAIPINYHMIRPNKSSAPQQPKYSILEFQQDVSMLSFPMFQTELRRCVLYCVHIYLANAIYKLSDARATRSFLTQWSGIPLPRNSKFKRILLVVRVGKSILGES